MKTSLVAALLSLALLPVLSTAEAAVSPTKSVKATKATKAKAVQTRKVKSVVLRKRAPVLRAVPTFGQVAGLHDVDDPLALRSSVAYVLVNALREVGLKGTEFQKAQCHTIRLKLFKIGAAIRVTVRKVWVSLSSSYPYAEIFTRVLENLRATPQPRPSPG